MESEYVELCVTLDKLVEDYGLRQVADALSEVCHARGDKYLAKFQDEYSYKQWHRFGKLFDIVCERLVSK